MSRGNEVVGMRLAPKAIQSLDAYRKTLMWSPGQVFTALLESEERMSQALATFQDVILDDGSEAVIVRDESGSWELLDGQTAECALYWLLAELKKPLSSRFVEAFQGWEIEE